MIHLIEIIKKEMSSLDYDSESILENLPIYEDIYDQLHELINTYVNENKLPASWLETFVII